MSESSAFESLYQEELYLIPSRTLVLIDRPWSEINEDEKALLYKILGSVKLSPAAVQILYKADTTINDLLTLSPARVICFGVAVSPVQKTYEYVPLDGTHIIVSDSLSRLDDQKKKSLWVGLRQMFGI
jgi:hypothetical protein